METANRPEAPADLAALTPAPEAGAGRFGDAFVGRAVLVTGGAGFIGSNLSRRLVDLGARVTVVDSLLPDYGG
ncbi:MAG TPA: NAD-dependent epimerase/dehydratase family protein, partial [Chloroflexota bacterium]|nr:NAD-dependent epimerase/dehydratase family protein [Chloroflexota bacterium]